MISKHRIGDKAFSLDFEVRHLHNHLENIKNKQFDMEYLNDTMGLLDDIQYDIKEFVKFVQDEIKYNG